MFSITPEKSIQDIQQEFSRIFPFLKVEFSLKGSGIKKFIPGDYFLKIMLTHTDGKKAENRQINITPAVTIKELKEKGEEVFGISIRVYRKFRNIWLESTITEHLTLQQHNDHLQEIDTCYA